MFNSTTASDVIFLAYNSLGLKSTVTDITNPQNDKEKEAVVLFKHCLNVSLEMFSWNFCSSVVTLDKDDNYTKDNYYFSRYKLPTNFLRLNFIYFNSNPDKVVKYEIQDDYLYLIDSSFSGDLTLNYNKQILQNNNFINVPNLFIEYLQILLATKLASSKDIKTKTPTLREVEFAYNKAVDADTSNSPPKIITDSDAEKYHSLYKSMTGNSIRRYYFNGNY